jgi:signal transduction histidine kinase/DNA-binding response OmpR family regulator
MMSENLILVVEDDKEIRARLTENVLTPAGYTVKSVGDGNSAVALVEELQPQLVITADPLPDFKDLILVKRLQREQPYVPVIVMAEDRSQEYMLKVLRAGAVDFVSVPFEPEQLLAAVGRALALRQDWQQVLQAQAEAKVNADSLERRIHELETLALIGRKVTAMLDLDEVLTTVVDAAVRLSGAEEGSLLLLDEDTGELYMRASKNFDEEFSTAFRLHTRDSLAGQVIATGTPVILDKRAPQKIKTSYLVHSLIYVPLNVRGHIIGVLGVDNRTADQYLNQEDITIMHALADYAAIAIENAQLYERSEIERSQFETILTQTENGVIVVDQESRVLLINRAGVEAFNVRGDIIGKSAVEVFDEPKLLELLRGADTLSDVEELEVSDGRTFSTQRTPVAGVGQAVILHDITHLKNLARIKSEFVTTVSHDLRSPLTAILGYVELIERAGSLNDQQHDFIERVRISVDRITSLVTDLLDLGRIEAGLDIARENSPIVVLARYAIDSLRGVAENKGVTLEVELPDEPLIVIGDPVRLRQMIGNLLDNALKYTPSGGTVRVEVEAEGDQMVLRVRDTGPGIPPADQPYLFDKFFRASNIEVDMPGTGLGLSIVKSIVDNHDGRIWVESKLGKGTTFTVVLALVEP